MPKSYMKLLDIEHGQTADAQYVYIVGHLGRDPETKYTANGNLLVKSSIAVNDEQDKAEWFGLVWWGNEEAAQLVKGQAIRLVGTLSEREYQGKTYKDITVRMFYAYKPKAKAAAPPSDLPPEPSIPF